jgi:hypothetical protein
MRPSELAALLQSHRFRFTSERDLQDGIAEVLAAASVPFRREAALAGAGTIDFLVASTGIEVKVKGTLAEVTRQLHRYAGAAVIDALLLVTTSARVSRLPITMMGKPLRVVHLLGSVL